MTTKSKPASLSVKRKFTCMPKPQWLFKVLEGHSISTTVAGCSSFWQQYTPPPTRPFLYMYPFCTFPTYHSERWRWNISQVHPHFSILSLCIDTSRSLFCKFRPQILIFTCFLTHACFPKITETTIPLFQSPLLRPRHFIMPPFHCSNSKCQ